jgi:tRNA(Ile)-lysidine synthase
MAPEPTLERIEGQPATVRLGKLLLRVTRRHTDALGSGPLVIAVSGGADSLAMLLAAATVRRSLKREIVVAHFSHGLRKSAERREAAQVRRVARRLQIPLKHEQAAVGASEASARDARYRFFSRVAASVGAAAVATAHTQNDQAETLLLRLTRGTGLRGAGAIRELSVRAIEGIDVTLLRPILGVTRDRTVAVCAEWGLKPASDGTNRSVRYARNRVRRRVLPELAEINPAAVAALSAFADTARDDDDLLTRLASQAVATSERRTPDNVTWATNVMRDLPAPLFARVIQSAWASLRRDGAVLSSSQIEASAGLLARGSGAIHLEGKASFTIEQDTASLSLARVSSSNIAPISLVLPGETPFGAWAITAKTEALIDHARDQWQATLDLDALGDDICVRSRVDGDRFQPLGMDQEVRLQDVLVNAKIPRSKRDGLPLIVAGGKIAWVAGVRIAEWAKVSERTTRTLVLQVRPPS